MLDRVAAALVRCARLVAGLPDPALRTARLQLRAFVPNDDWRKVWEYWSDPLVLRYLALAEPASEVQVYDMLCAHRSLERSSRSRFYAVVRRADGALIGECSALTVPSQPDVGYLGFVFRSDCWGLGYATEAARVAMRYSFTELRLSRMMAGCHPENAKSRRVIHKLGMHAAEARADFPGAPPGVTPLVFSVGAEAWLREDEGGGPSGSSAVLRAGEGHSVHE